MFGSLVPFFRRLALFSVNCWLGACICYFVSCAGRGRPTLWKAVHMQKNRQYKYVE